MVKPAEQDDGDHRRPDLDAQGVFAGSDKGFDLEILLEGFEEDFDLPAFLINAGDCGWRKNQVVGDQDKRIVVFGPYSDSSQRLRIATAVAAGVADQLVLDNVRGVDLVLLENLIDWGIRRAANEIRVLRIPLREC